MFLFSLTHTTLTRLALANHLFFPLLQDRPWNDPGPRRGKAAAVNAEIASRPTLKAVVLDFSAVNFVDVTSAQALIDLRKQFGRYATPDIVEWHFAGVTNRWTKRALVASGFGYELGDGDGDDKLVAVVVPQQQDEERGGGGKGGSGSSSVDGKEMGTGTHEVVGEVEHVRTTAQTREGGLVPVFGVNRPFFHVDLVTAVEAAVRGAERRVLMGVEE